MGFDWGTKRIGVAVGQSVTRTASPLEVIAFSKGVHDWTRIDALLREWRPVRLVVGRPLNMDGTRQKETDLADAFAAELAKRSQLPTDAMDERLSSRAARGLGNATGMLDALAAKLILESWFADNRDQRCSAESR